MNKFFINTRFYKYVEDTVIELKIVKFYNAEKCKCKVIKGPDTGIEINIPIKTLQDEYTMLSNDGIIIFNIVKINDTLDDVMVTVFRSEDMIKGINIPNVVCRQCVLDLFAKMIDPNKADYVGLSISKETCPADIEFENFLACESIKHSVVLAYYIGDTLDDILSLFKHNEFDSTLHCLFINHCDSFLKTNPAMADYLRRKGEADGYVQNISDLLKLNNFEYDLYRTFNIIPTTLDSEHFTDGVLSKLAEKVLSEILRAKIYKSLVIKYDKDIDLEAINKKYCLVSDKNGTVYIVAYFVNGTYYTNIDDDNEQNIEKLVTLMGTSKSLQHAYENIKFSKKKYEK